jgi:hypothetical protein
MKLKLAILSLGLSVAVINCKQDELIESSEESSKPSSERVAAEYAERTINFDKSTYTDNAVYTKTWAETDHGNLTNPDKFNLFGHGRINQGSSGNKQLEVKIPKNTMSDTFDNSDQDGLRYNVSLPDKRGYELRFDVTFSNNFEWSRGGKIGPGLVIGGGASGCYSSSRPYPKDGASVRFMWKGVGQKGSPSDDVWLVPYVYHVGIGNSCGTEFDKKSVKLERGKKYTCYMKVINNTGRSSNGSLFMSVNGTQLLSLSNFKFTDTDASQLIKQMSFNVFRGGSTTNWEASIDNTVYFDNIYWNDL